MELSLVKSLTIDNVKLPYAVVVIYDNGSDKELRKQLIERYNPKDFSCNINSYISTATVHFRNEVDAADFLMRV